LTTSKSKDLTLIVMLGFLLIAFPEIKVATLPRKPFFRERKADFLGTCRHIIVIKLQHGSRPFPGRVDTDQLEAAFLYLIWFISPFIPEKKIIF